MANRYLTLTGDNGNGGTSIDDSWQTLTYANGQLNAGDTLWMGGGNYDITSIGRIEPSNNGTDGSPITYRGITDELPNLTGADTVFYMSGKSYISIMDIQGRDITRFATITADCDHITISSCSAYNCSSYQMIILRGSSGCTIVDNYIDREDVSEDEGDAIWLEGYILEPCTNHYIARNWITNCTHAWINMICPGGSHYDSNTGHVIESNTALQGHSGIDVKANRCLVQNNLLYRAQNWNSPHAFQTGGSDNIVRQNYILNYGVSGWTGIDECNAAYEINEPPARTCSGSRFYHNTIVGEGWTGSYTSMCWKNYRNDSDADLDDLIFKNNIFYNSGYTISLANFDRLHADVRQPVDIGGDEMSSIVNQIKFKAVREFFSARYGSIYSHQ